MDSNGKQSTTDFDSIVSAKQLQIIKAAIPYVPIGEQRFMSVYVKVTELMNTFKIFNNVDNETVGICSVPEESRNPTAMLNAIRDYCDEKEIETIDMLMNFMSASSLYNTYKKQSETTSDGSSKNFDMFSTFKNMLSPEQQAMFETYSSILGGL